MKADEYARTALNCLDLTSLSGKEDESTVRSICDRAVGRYGAVAAVCFYPKLAGIAKEVLQGSEVKVAAVVNFPKGEGGIEQSVLEVRDAISKGADEIDYVFSYKEFMAGNRAAAREKVKAVREECGDKVLKVILETGILRKALHIANASRDCIECGADFIKTSTGMVDIGATSEAANAMLEVIREMGTKKKVVGFKASGGIKNMDQCRSYIDLARSLMGEGYISPDTFRIGASKLFDEILKTLGY